MPAYYNEIDPYAAQWLRNLIADGQIAPGDVDERSIVDVRAGDLKGYEQCHFFAGIGGWSVALRLAGWDDSRPVWTGSCPCQPFSAAGRKKRQSDERHLWPYWYRLIRESRPTAIFGEQVASAITDGWLDDVLQGLEKEAYSCASAVLPACAAGGGHPRDRLFFVGYAEHHGRFTAKEQGSDGKAIQRGKEGQNCAGQSQGTSDIRALADLTGQRQSESGNMARRMQPEADSDREANQFIRTGEGLSWIQCPDGFWRPCEPTIPLLVDGISPDMVKICSRGFGNAIHPGLTAEFIKATM